LPTTMNIVCLHVMHPMWGCHGSATWIWCNQTSRCDTSGVAFKMMGATTSWVASTQWETFCPRLKLYKHVRMSSCASCSLRSGYDSTSLNFGRYHHSGCDINSKFWKLSPLGLRRVDGKVVQKDKDLHSRFRRCESCLYTCTHTTIDMAFTAFLFLFSWVSQQINVTWENTNISKTAKRFGVMDLFLRAITLLRKFKVKPI